MTTDFPDTDWEPRGCMMAHDTFEEALQASVAACGGNKAVAAKFWPAKDVYAARDYLAACLNPHRKEKLDLGELLKLLRDARLRGCHAGMEFLTAHLSYAPTTPITPAEEHDELQRKMLQTADRMQKLADRMFDAAKRDGGADHAAAVGIAQLRQLRA